MTLSHPFCPHCHPPNPASSPLSSNDGRSFLTSLLDSTLALFQSFLHSSSVAFSENQLSSCQLPAELKFFQFLKWTELYSPSTNAVSLPGPLLSASHLYGLAPSSFCSPRCLLSSKTLMAVPATCPFPPKWLNVPFLALITCHHNDGFSDCLLSLDWELHQEKSLFCSPPYL